MSLEKYHPRVHLWQEKCEDESPETVRRLLFSIFIDDPEEHKISKALCYNQLFQVNREECIQLGESDF